MNQNNPQQYPPGNQNWNYPQIQEDSIDLKKYFFLILANWYWIIISVFVSLAVAFLVTRYTKPVYEVRASLIVSENDRGSGGLTGYENLIPGMEIFRTQKLVMNEMEILKSYSLTQRALKELDFNITYIGVGRSGLKENYQYNNAPFFVIPDTSKTNINGYRVKVELFSKEKYRVIIDDNYDIDEIVQYGQAFESDPFNFKLYLKDPVNFNPPGYDSYYFIFNSLNSLTNQYRSRLNIEVNDDRRGSILFLNSSGYNAEQEANYLNKLMQVYIQIGLEEKNQTANNTVDFIDQQLGILDDSLQQAEMNLQEFRLSNRLIDVSKEGTIAYNRLERLERELAQLNLQERYYTFLKNYIQDKNNLNTVVAPTTVDINDPLLANLIQQLNELISEKEELLFTVQRGNQRFEIIEAKIENTRSALVDNIEGLIENNTIAKNELQKQLLKAENDLQKLPVTERELISIEREYNVNDQIYTYLLQKRAEAAIARASNVADNKILDIARPENAGRTAPKSRMNYMIGLIIGLGLPIGILFLLDITNNKITSRKDIENKLHIPIIAHIGHSTTGEIPVFENPRSALAESFRGLRTNLHYLLREKDEKLITITSTISGEGKTFVSLNLATIFALAGKKTLLVGLDLRKPKIHKVFNLNNKKGISTYLIGNANFDDIIETTEISNLYIAPSGPIPPNPAELLETMQMEEFINKARDTFDMVIFDTPPFGIVIDSLLIGLKSDANLFLVRQNYSSKDVSELINEVKVKKELKNLAVIFNDLRIKGTYRTGYRYYNYGYRYGYLYGSEYHN